MPRYAGTPDTSITATGQYELGDGSPFTASQMAIQLVKTTSFTIEFEASMDGTTWFDILAYPVGSETGVTSVTDNALVRVDCSGVRVRLNVTAITGALTLVFRPLVG